MVQRSDNAVMRVVRDFVTTLKSSHLLMLVTFIFVLDLFLPDGLPMVDEIILGILTILVARWKSRGRTEPADPSLAKPPPKDVTPRATPSDAARQDPEAG